MSISTVLLIFRRELRDQLRDRRTLFMIVVLPVVLYPLVGIAVVQIMLHFGERQYLVGIVGKPDSPSLPTLFDADNLRFNVANVDGIRTLRTLRIVARPQLAAADADEERGRPVWKPEDVEARRIDVLIEFPRDLAENLSKGGGGRVRIIRNPISDRSALASAAVASVLKRWESRIVNRRIAELNKDPQFHAPIELSIESASEIAAPTRRSGSIWGKILPLIIVVMALTGAFYPAIDLCAGEKERGTIETLLISPASRVEIVMGKFLAIALFSLATGMFNLVSMGLTVGHVAQIASQDLPAIADSFAAPSVDAILWMSLMMMPLSGLFAAVCMALAIFARSTKEGQYYLMPVFLVVMPLAMLTLLPGVELTAFSSLVPIANVALLLQSLVNGQFQTAAVYCLPVLLPTAIYGYLALLFAVDRFEREDVIFREAERFDLRLWIARIFEAKRPFPSAAEAWFCFILMVLLQYYVQGRLPLARWSLVVSQLALILFPAALLAIFLTSDPLRTLGLHRPAALPTTLSLLLAITLHPVAVNVGGVIQQLMPLSEDLFERLRLLIGQISLGRKLLLFALLPAICEEFAFRGFILSGLARSGSVNRAVFVSAVLFGLFHMIPQQMFLTMLIGFILGMVRSRSGSLLPGVVFHSLHNGLMIVRAELMQTLPMPEQASASIYPFNVMVMSALASAILAGLLFAMRPRMEESEPPPSAG